jgi:hypothetical protein
MIKNYKTEEMTYTFKLSVEVRVQTTTDCEGSTINVSTDCDELGDITSPDIMYDEVQKILKNSKVLQACKSAAIDAMNEDLLDDSESDPLGSRGLSMRDFI